MSMKKWTAQRLAVSGVLAALVWLFTYLIKIPSPATGGYIHLGDGLIFLAAYIIGPYAALVGGIGSALADVLGGYFVYAAPTFCIKAAMGWVAGKWLKKNAPLRNALIFAAAEGIMVAGYFVFEGVFFGWAAALTAVGLNALQGVAGVVVGLALTSLPLNGLLGPE